MLCGVQITVEQFEELNARNQSLGAEVKTLKDEIKFLNDKVKYLLKQLFGAKSEKIDPNQLTLLFDAQAQLAAAEEAAEGAAEVAPARRRAKRRPLAARLPDDLPVETVVIEPEEVLADPEAYKKIGEARLDFFQQVPDRRRPGPAIRILLQQPPDAVAVGRPVGIGPERPVQVLVFAVRHEVHGLARRVLRASGAPRQRLQQDRRVRRVAALPKPVRQQEQAPRVAVQPDRIALPLQRIDELRPFPRIASGIPRAPRTGHLDVFGRGRGQRRLLVQQFADIDFPPNHVERPAAFHHRRHADRLAVLVARFRRPPGVAARFPIARQEIPASPHADVVRRGHVGQAVGIEPREDPAPAVRRGRDRPRPPRQQQPPEHRPERNPCVHPASPRATHYRQTLFQITPAPRRPASPFPRPKVVAAPLTEPRSLAAQGAAP